ncbi:MAG: transglycosylase SLT domain-containing protein [Synergistaceae bacterium]|jgi:soluble lytic murein transglycosylase-like protein|nr:transglycosylase SLT domain-containing protein [Synergistaceae bacterium]
MEWILERLLGMVITTAQQAQVPPELVLALIEAESGGNPYAARLTANYPYTVMQASRPSACDLSTENIMQKTAWGLMQLMGATARSLGFDGWLPELAEPKVCLPLGAEYLKRLMGRYHEKYGLAGVVSACNTGTPRTRPDGKFVNQGYVDKVLKTMEKYKPIVREKENETAEEEAVPSSENDDRPAKRKKGASSENS